MRTLAIYGFVALIGLTSCKFDRSPLGNCEATHSCEDDQPGTQAGQGANQQPGAGTDSGEPLDGEARNDAANAQRDAGSLRMDAGKSTDAGKSLDAGKTSNDGNMIPVPQLDAGHDAGRDAGHAAGHDAGHDAGTNDAGHDAGHDAGTSDAGDSGAAHVPSCGDGTLDNGEACDDGNHNDDDGCSASCVVECGDGTIGVHEQCESGQLNGATCVSRGFVGGTLGCGNDCQFDTHACLAQPVCNNGTLEVGETCEDGNLKNGDGCSSSCRVEPNEIEPNEDGSPSVGLGTIGGNDFNATAVSNADRNGAFDAKNGAVNIRAAITPAGDEDVFAITNTTQTAVELQLEIWNRALGFGFGVPCADSIDTGLNLRNASGTLLASNDDRNGSNDRCSGLNYTLAPGQTVYAQVVEFGDNGAIPGYLLEVQYLPIVCGDGLHSSTEECEDHNTDNGDGCSSTCRYEGVTPEVEPNANGANATASSLQITGDTLIGGAIASVGDQDVYRLTLATPTVVRFETFTSLIPSDCASGTALELRLFSANSTLLLADTESLGIAGCASLVIYLDAGTYFVRVEESGNNASVASYFLDVAYQADRGAETEGANMSGGNDTRQSAAGNLSSGTDIYVFGNHMLVDDSDYYTVYVPAGAAIRAEVIEGDRNSETCESNGIDSRLTLYDQTGAQRSDDDDNGRGFCSLLDGTGSNPVNASARNTSASAQTFYLQVRRAAAATGTARQFAYRLQVTLRK